MKRALIGFLCLTACAAIAQVSTTDGESDPAKISGATQAEIDANTAKVGYTAAAAEADGFITNGLTFYDRGDPTTFDFQLSDLTTDGTWRDMDLGAIVGTNAVQVLLSVQIKDNLVGSDLALRENGNTNVFNASWHFTQAASESQQSDAIVQTDSSGIIEYKAENLVWSGIWIYVRGWWK